MTFGRYQPRPAKQMDYTPRPRPCALLIPALAAALAPSLRAPIQKFEYVRSKKLLEACRQIACQHCGRDDGTVVAAHSNQAIHGKGKSIKASDVFVAALCFWCHAEIDQGSKLDQETRVAIWTRAWVRTVAELQRRGLWPAEIPVPDTSHVPQPQAIA